MHRRPLLGLALAGLVLMAAAPTADSAPQTSSGFVVVVSPTFGYSGGSLTGVAAVSSSDVWAIGSHRGGTRLLEHYDGSSWSAVAPPPLPHGQLTAISAHGSAVWIVGRCRVATGYYGCVARHTGSQWVRVAIPWQLSHGLSFKSVLVFSDTNVLVGGGGLKQMIRWNGRAWSEVDGLPEHHAILGIAGTLSTHLFAMASGPLFEREQPDGSWLWDYPFPPETRAGPISASSAENVWVFGTTAGAGGSLPQARRWNGTTELSVPVSSDPTSSYVYGAVTTRPHNTWAVGTQQTAPFGPFTTLIERYTGGISFTDLDSPNTAGAYNQLRAITAVPGSESDLWAVGQGGDGQPLILHHAP